MWDYLLWNAILLTKRTKPILNNGLGIGFNSSCIMETDILTREFAQKRAELISDVSYKIKLAFKKQSKTYRGVCQLKFLLLKTIDDPLKIDFIGNVKLMIVNGQLSNFKKEKFAVFVPERNLREGENTVEIEYENEYDKTGTGLHNFVDPEDGKEYIYSHLEPYFAHSFFPCFDQPDLKAAYRLTVESPKEWTAISNSPEESMEEKADFKMTVFKETKKFSTYLFHISVGEYCHVADRFGILRLRIFCRQSVKKYLRQKEMFLFTKQGLEFYQKFFDFQYPFEKYDQIFVPEFNHGAMENVGAVTFSEHLLYRHEPTRTEMARLADVVLHEMVHMWFGDLVTMKWWDGIWLNESFADFLSYLGLVRATEFKDGWQSFYARKAWAYAEDQWVTTHPIAADAPDTDMAFANFDGISYSKGAAVLKQLMFFIGEEAFKKGLSDYFKKYQWGNTRLKDFLDCMAEASGKNLDSWSRMWLETTGVNTIEPVIEMEKGKIKSFFIKQHPSAGNNLLREHRSEVALLSKNKIVKQVSVEYKGELTEAGEIFGLSKPDIVLLNYNDQDYVKERLDQDSVGFVLKNIEKIKDDLSRQMLYGSLWQMVRDALLDPKKYLELVINKAPKEENLFILESLFSRVAMILGNYVNEKEYYSYCEKFYRLGWENLNKNIGSQLKDDWFSLMAAVSSGCKSPDKLADLLKGKIKIKNFVFNQDQRWSAINRLAVVGYPKVDSLIEDELEKDPSDIGRKEAFSAQVAKPEKKKEHWELFVQGKKHSLDYLRSGMRAFYSRKQKEKLRAFIDLFFGNIMEIFETKNKKYSEDFYDNLFPRVYVEAEFSKKLKDFLKTNPDMHMLLKENLLESLDELERALKILEKFG